MLAIALTACMTSRGEEPLDRAISLGPEDFLERAAVGPMGDGTWVVPTTQHIAPAGDTKLFPGRPVSLALTPDGKTIAVKNIDSVLFFDTQSREIIQTLRIPHGGTSFEGIAFSKDGGRLYVTSAEKELHVAERRGDSYAWLDPIALPGPSGTDDSVPGGIAVLDGGRALVTMSRNNTVGLVDLKEGKLVTQLEVGIAPFDVKVIGSKAYVTNWGGRRPKDDAQTGPTSGSQMLVNETGVAASGTVSVIDVTTTKVIGEIDVELHPGGMAVSPGGDRLYVANSNSDSVSVIDTDRDRVIATWLARPMKELPFGSAPNALAVSPDGARLYVALGGTNCLAVMDTASGKILGLIPTGWYPGAVVTVDGGDTLVVANTKGTGSRDSRPGEARKSQRGLSVQNFNSHDHFGSISFIKKPTPDQLDDYTYEVAVNMRLPRMIHEMNLPKAQPRVVPVPTRPNETSVFKHVIYIIKENRSYDQVLGDMPQGNGEPELVQFGREVSPNHHALADEFVLLDNLYCNGVLSADGHHWATEGFVTDYLERAFGGFNRSYPYEGDDMLANASSGFIWDHVLAAGHTFRDYGEMVHAHFDGPRPSWTDFWEDYTSGEKQLRFWATTDIPGLKPYICPGFIGFPNVVQDVRRADVFIDELADFEQNGNLPNFVIMLLPNDHTVGTRPDNPTPRAMVADNDLALGRIVDAVSHSRFWPETAIFVVEDDPQAGLDHVDGHRTVSFCVSPYTKRGSVDSTFYTQNSILRTIELILGLAPMNQFNLAANPMVNCFTDKPDFSPYTARPNQIPLDEMNPALEATRGLQRELALASLEMPLDEVDEAPEDLLNRVIWHSTRGYDTPYPRLPGRERDLDD